MGILKLCGLDGDDSEQKHTAVATHSRLNGFRSCFLWGLQSQGIDVQQHRPKLVMYSGAGEVSFFAWVTQF